MTHTNDDPWYPRLSEHLDGELTAAEEDELTRHLAGCARCAAALVELRGVIAMLHHARETPAPAPLDRLWPWVNTHLSTELAQPAEPEPLATAWPARALVGALLLALGFGSGVWFGASGCRPRHGWTIPGLASVDSAQRGPRASTSIRSLAGAR